VARRRSKYLRYSRLLYGRRSCQYPQYRYSDFIDRNAVRPVRGSTRRQPAIVGVSGSPVAGDGRNNAVTRGYFADGVVTRIPNVDIIAAIDCNPGGRIEFRTCRQTPIAGISGYPGAGDG
jgi:hypothetical protein